MLPSISFKSLSIAVAALGVSGLAPNDGGARVAPPMPGTIARVAAPLSNGGSDDVTTTVKKASDGLFYVTAHVNGHPTRFVVDTGANVVVLTPADAKAAGIAVRAGTPRQTLQTAGGGRAMHRADIARLTIAGQAVDHAEAVVMSGDGPPHSLLGQSALARFRAVTIRGDRLDLTV